VRRRARADVAIDIGTERTRLLARGRTVAEAPTRDPASGRRIVVRGVIVNAEGAARLAARLMAEAPTRAGRAHCAVASCPQHLARARPRLEKALRLAGVEKVELVGSVVAAAAGAGVDVSSPYAEMVADVGAGLTEVAVFRDGAALHEGTIPIGTRDLRGGGKRGQRADVPPAPAATRSLAEQLFTLWKGLPLDAQVEIIENGLVLTGGGAAMPELVTAIESTTRLSVRPAPDPSRAVIRGLARLALGVRVP
jgi:rod shape-determining protein MreB